MKKEHKTNRFIASLIAVIMLIASLSGTVCVSADEETADPFADSVFKNYLTRKGSILYDGDEVFRSCVGLADAGLVSQEDGGHHLADEFEIRDAFEAMKQLGQNSTRTGWPFARQAKSVDGKIVGEGKPGEKVMIEGPGKYSERAFRAMDKMLQLANEYGIRLFIPMFCGSLTETFAAYRGLPSKDFYNSLQLIEDTKAFFTYMLNRTNYYTGVKYKDDPAVLAWEIGNELDRSGCTTEWVNVMSAHIKSIDQNHLVAAPQTHYWKDVIDDPNIDIVDTHIYDAMPFKEMVEGDIAAIDGKKALILGEIGMKDGDFFSDDFLPWVAEKPQVCASYMFMLGAHNSLGGIYCHSSGTDYPNLVYPGYDDADEFASTSGKWNPKHLFESIKKINYGKMGIDVPEIPKPRAPHLLPVTNVHDIWWRGSTGAQFYDIERAESESGPWTLIAENVQDNKQYRYRNFSDGVFRTLFDDSTAEDGKTYYYRVKAKTEKGVESDWSNVRKSGDVTLDSILQAEKDADIDALAQPLITVDIPKKDGVLVEKVKEEVIRANLPAEVKNQLTNAVVLKVGESTAFVNNKVKKIDPERENIVAYTKNDRTLVPVRFLSESFDCTVGWDDNTQTVAIFAGYTSSSMRIGENIITVTDQGYDLDQPAELVDDARVFAPLRAVCELSLKKSVLYKDGIIVVYDGKSVKNPDDESFWKALDDGFKNPIDDNILPDQAAATEGNAFPDGGFENEELPTYWTGASPNNVITSEDSHSGVYSLKFYGDGLNWTGIRSSALEVKPNTDYILAFYSKAPAVLQNGERIAVTYKLVNATYTDNWYTPDYRLGKSEDWVLRIIPFNVGDSSVRIPFSVNAGTVYIDDMICVEANSPEGQKILAEYNAQTEEAAPSEAVIIDNMTDFSKINKCDQKLWSVCTDNADTIGGGIARSADSKNQSASLVYKVDRVKALRMEYAYKGTADIKLYFSADGENWTDKNVKSYVTGTADGWSKAVLVNVGEIDRGNNYIKIELTDQNSDYDTPRITKIEVY